MSNASNRKLDGEAALKTLAAIGVLIGAGGLWFLLTKIATGPGQVPDPGKALELGKQYLGFATSLAGFLGIAVGGAAVLRKDFKNYSDTQLKGVMTATSVGLLVTLAGGAMVGGDQWVPAAALVAGFWGAAYFLK